MTVRELIEALSAHDPDAEVFVLHEGSYAPVQVVTKNERDGGSIWLNDDSEPNSSRDDHGSVD